MHHRIIMGICGASGMPLGMAVLNAFTEISDLEVHLIVSPHAEAVMQAECHASIDTLTKLARFTWSAEDMSAGPSSGSWMHDGMVICPCSMSSLASIASGAGMNLIHRAADVTIKEHRPLVLVVRETPFNRIHLRNMCTVAEAGGTIMPFMPAFYSRNEDLPALMHNFAGRILDQMHIPNELCQRWRNNGLPDDLAYQHHPEGLSEPHAFVSHN